MGFTDKLREALGAEGVQIEAEVPEETVNPGGTLRATVAATGGTKEARLEAHIVRLIMGTRRWSDRAGNPVSEEDALAEVDRSHLVATWDRHEVAELRINVGHELQPGERHETSVELAVPTDCQPSTLARTYTVNVQADVKGQIDPTANARVRLA
jgi:sporulation-control protein spo0M